jgi:hypothetical protein
MINGLSPCEHRSRFVLIDLGVQIRAVQSYTAGWSPDKILSWLLIYGTVHSEWKSGYFVFEPRAFPSLSCGFWFDEKKAITSPIRRGKGIVVL